VNRRGVYGGSVSEVLWEGRCASRGLALLGVGVALVVAAVGLGTVVALGGSGAPRWTGWLVVVLGVLVGLVTWLFSSLVVRLTAESFVVAFGPWRFPRRRIALADVVDASAVRVEPEQWGGWGYRWNPWAKASAAVVRTGPGIALSLRDGRRFAVTVDDAVAGAQATSAALTRAR
jgi:hypothetical protein